MRIDWLNSYELPHISSTETDKDIANHVYLTCRKLGIKYEFPLQNETTHEVEYIR
jgi:hypothetical protein